MIKFTLMFVGTIALGSSIPEADSVISGAVLSISTLVMGLLTYSKLQELT